MMECKRCGYKAKDIAHMSAHYRKVHPKAMMKKKESVKTGAMKLTKEESALLKKILRR